MSDLDQVNKLIDEIDQTLRAVKIADVESEKKTLVQQSQAPNFWQNPEAAQTIMKQIARCDEQIKPWRELEKEASDIRELLALDDASLQAEINTQFKALQTNFEHLKKELVFSGPYDRSAVILSIHAGAGGTDAQDWAEMLLRMYVRWSETHDMNVKTIEQSNGEEAGIKSATIEIGGPLAYGKLKGEHGVHRLVRLSPFNADNLRQTSFAKVEIMPKIDSPDAVEIDEKDLKIDVYRSGGHGGQSVNTTDSAVRITHIPTNIVVAIQNERSQLQNKETAMTILRSRLAQLQMEQHKEKISELKGPNQSAEWGNQIRSYVLHPYKQVKDLRTKHESSDPDKVLGGDLDAFIDAYHEHNLS